MIDIVKIELSFRPGLASAHDLFEWCKENNIKIVNETITIVVNPVKNRPSQFLFFFYSEGDAAAFKLCWC